MAVMDLEGIPIDEVLRYLGAAGKDPGPLLPLAEACCRELLAAARPRWTWRVFACEETPEGVRLDCGLLLPGEDLRRHLSGCREAVLLAATLSQGVDALLRRTQLCDLSRSLVLESCATAAIGGRPSSGRNIRTGASPAATAPATGTCLSPSRGSCWPCWTPPGSWASAPRGAASSPPASR